MQTCAHPTLAELQVFLHRNGQALTPSGQHRIQLELVRLDALHTAVAELGGIDAIREAMLAHASAEQKSKRK